MSTTPVQQHPAFGYGEIHNREVNWLRRTSRGSGNGTASRVRRIIAVMQQMEKDLKGRYVLPKPTKSMKRIAPGLFRKATLRPSLPFAKAEIATHFIDSRGYNYVRLTNGTITRAFRCMDDGVDSIFATPVRCAAPQVETLSVPNLNFPRA